jgi:DNA-binding MarR family transcriptional regulator
MDRRWSAAAVAAELGTSVPRVVRAVERLGLGQRRSGRVALSADEAARLRRELGVTPAVDGLSRTEVKALAALGRAPLGLVSARAVAARAGLSPTAASRAVKALEVRGLARREAASVAAGRARRVEMLHANRRAERWMELAPLLARVEPPRRAERDERVPTRLMHLFWNTAPSQLDVEHGGPYIARRLLRTFDPDGLAWGARNLRPADWREAAAARGLPPDVRTLARNLAAAGEG